ncbi:hypothetical protein C2G38_2037034 [Gigaspora rosea]|uniref:BED-type domain-containing protein n=1 Tax=Gigaspora rosea TaxID=44941 RepID=A0A397V9C7_9GLOM|nr:hypothetical protein C2G38_2037034 [Gigaspora rosea]
MNNYEMIDDNKYYPNNYYYEIAKDSRTSTETFSSAATTPSVQTTYFSKLSDSKNKTKESVKKRPYKHKQPSFTRDYFDKKVNEKGKEVRVCKIINEGGQKCGTEFKSIGSLTGNLITHLRDNHGIVSQDGEI